jgi:ssDNA-binding Zn-finger/Zn-ribbon topoisomerase 1
MVNHDSLKAPHLGLEYSSNECGSSFFNRSKNRAMTSKFFVCFNYIKNRAINNMSMSICKTTHNVYPPILENLLTTFENNINK